MIIVCFYVNILLSSKKCDTFVDKDIVFDIVVGTMDNITMKKPTDD